MSRSWIITVTILVLVVGGIYLAWCSLIEMGYESCVLSIEDGIANTLMLSEFSEKIPVSDEWRTLTDDEERLLFDEFKSEGRRFDCKNFGDYANGDVFRGENGRIKVRKVDRQVAVRVEINDGRVREYS